MRHTVSSWQRSKPFAIWMGTFQWEPLFLSADLPRCKLLAEDPLWRRLRVLQLSDLSNIVTCWKPGKNTCPNSGKTWANLIILRHFHSLVWKDPHEKPMGLVPPVGHPLKKGNPPWMSRRWIFTSKHSRYPAASARHSTASSDVVHVSARWVVLIAKVVWWKLMDVWAQREGSAATGTPK